ncbi:nicotinamide-nucleotide amidase [Microbacteriaceae bacterium SG_E_30_P1]|uniref:Nicotinamide-nucleotide amidase n=1 Tax=Antiquaquibacter oligotrophicus TaxID=2880260 RepID=A0ABT6KLR0_9MICO|nr:CinA family protein [Antiquaquibacter oligotrophicus]MDH6180686.1 nicotinamide-nucleotide amidase [Antiquaquibacter oligotrophicus]UDF13588.1 CinA family protein [Antiquaquibacter oligotrophicus]
MRETAIISLLRERGLTLAVAESLTGGMLVARLIDVPGASNAVLGGVVAYDTRLKHSVLGVDSELLAERGPVDGDVARQMADRVRTVLAVDGRPADVGVATTGVAGPDPQGDAPVGTVYIGIAVGNVVSSRRVMLSGDRHAIREATVSEALLSLAEALT